MKRIPTYLALVAVSVLFLFPFYWVVISALKSVEGISMKPPSMYPAEVKTASLTQSVADCGQVDDQTWMWLTDSRDLLSKESAEGSYWLQLDHDGKPTQLVKWFPRGTIQKQGRSLATSIKFPKTPIYDIDGAQRPVLAKVVRPRDDGFDELLFAVDPFEGEDKATDSPTGISSVRIFKNSANHEVRAWAAHPENFAKALAGPEATIGGQSSGFLLFMRNSFFISGMAVLGQILASSLVAFGFSRMNFKGRDGLFILLIATLMVPAQVTLIPLFTIYKSLGWIDTFLPLIVPHFTAGAFNIFLIRQFMLTFPRELDESAAIDGATPFRVYRSIILPMCGPVLIVVGLFTFVGTWQDVMGPLIYLDNPNYRTVSLGLEFFRSPYVDNRPLLMAGAVLAMLPVAVLFLFAQRYIMSGIATSGLK